MTDWSLRIASCQKHQTCRTRELLTLWLWTFKVFVWIWTKISKQQSYTTAEFPSTYICAQSEVQVSHQNLHHGLRFVESTSSSLSLSSSLSTSSSSSSSSLLSLSSCVLICRLPLCPLFHHPRLLLVCLLLILCVVLVFFIFSIIFFVVVIFFFTAITVVVFFLFVFLLFGVILVVVFFFFIIFCFVFFFLVIIFFFFDNCWRLANSWSAFVFASTTSIPFINSMLDVSCIDILEQNYTLRSLFFFFLLAAESCLICFLFIFCYISKKGCFSLACQLDENTANNTRKYQIKTAADKQLMFSVRLN